MALCTAYSSTRISASTVGPPVQSTSAFSPRRMDSIRWLPRPVMAVMARQSRVYVRERVSM